MVQKYVVLAVLASVMVACGGGSGGTKSAACMQPAGVWTLKLNTSDSACNSATLQADFTKADKADGCKLVSQTLDQDGCVFMQEAKCAGYTETNVFTLDAGATSLIGTSTVEADDGTVCDFDVTGSK